MTNDKFKGQTNKSEDIGSTENKGISNSGSNNPVASSSSTGKQFEDAGKGGSFSGNSSLTSPSFGSTSGSTGGAATKQAREDSSLMAQVKQTANQAYDVASEKAVAKLDEQKSTLSTGLTSVADSVRQVAQNLHSGVASDGITKATAQYGDTAAQKIEQVANYFDSKDINAMYRDAESFARKNPMLVVGGAFVVGLLAARFLKSGSANARSTVAGDRSFGGKTTSEFSSPIL